jgi:hypothetical protein
MEDFKEIILLPLDKCKVATIIKFKIKCLNKFRDASIVYFHPLINEYEGKLKDFNNIIRGTLQEIEDINSETISFEIRNILFEEEKNNIFQCYANGGPQIKLEIFLTPSLSIDDCFNLGTGCMKGYKLSLNINIAPFNNFSLFPLEIESEFSMDYKDCLKWSVDNIEIL